MIHIKIWLFVDIPHHRKILWYWCTVITIGRYCCFLCVLPEDLSRQHFLPVLQKCFYYFSGQKNTMKYVRKKGRMHDHIQRTLAAKAAEMVRRKQYFLPKVGRSRYACNTGSACCQQEYSIKCTYGNTECWISSYLPLLVVFRSIISLP